VTVLPRSLRKLWSRSILKMIGIFIGNRCSLGMKKRQSKWRKDFIKNVWKMGRGKYRKYGRLVGYRNWLMK
jgi:hypothetical protein